MHLVDDAITKEVVVAEDDVVTGEVAEAAHGEIRYELLIDDEIALAVVRKSTERAELAEPKDAVDRYLRLVAPFGIPASSIDRAQKGLGHGPSLPFRSGTVDR